MSSQYDMSIKCYNTALYSGLCGVLVTALITSAKTVFGANTGILQTTQSDHPFVDRSSECLRWFRPPPEETVSSA